MGQAPDEPWELNELDRPEAAEGSASWPPASSDEYHMARQLAVPSGRDGWVYSCLSGSEVRPIGYCNSRCEHPTREDAEQHYSDFLLDRTTFDGKWKGVYYCCELCGEWTDSFAQVRPAFVLYHLCGRHMDRASVETLLSGPDGFRSYPEYGLFPAGSGSGGPGLEAFERMSARLGGELS
jgi:hypothetical protein